MSRKHPPEKRRAILDLANRHDQREIARMLGVSKGFVSSVIREPYKARYAALRAAAAPTPAPSTPALPKPPTVEALRAAKREALVAAVYAAETPETYAAATLALMRHEDADLDRWLTEGSSLHGALANGDRYPTLVVLRTPEALAEQAIFVTDPVTSYERDEEAGETEEQYQAWLSGVKAASHAAAVDLLENALAIVRATAPGERTP